ncbi:hypothetical protein ACJZ2D_011564 [Fusarium nematophilum]
MYSAGVEKWLECVELDHDAEAQVEKLRERLGESRAEIEETRTVTMALACWIQDHESECLGSRNRNEDPAFLRWKAKYKNIQLIRKILDELDRAKDEVQPDHEESGRGRPEAGSSEANGQGSGPDEDRFTDVYREFIRLKARARDARKVRDLIEQRNGTNR